MAEFTSATFAPPTTTAPAAEPAAEPAAAAAADPSTAVAARALGSLGSLLPSSESARSALAAAWERSRPWSEFANTAQMATPAAADVKDRVVENAKYYSFNYLFIVVVVTALNVLLHPLSFLGVIIILALYMYLFVANPEPLALGGLELDHRAKTAALAIFALLTLWLTGAGAAFVSLLFMLAALAGIHMAFRKAPNEVDFDTAYTPAANV
eukprot:CAMPEP_0198308474 /NCGR_PEP_ID=MMETSP1450-20131203/1114_1 /TAXON_ID=753684 ORGANISM="Madagascaria erythrocladiodes, Strain CCMP3234" /NCGR_SAMPLE_ID=MMETSP1450 /ASSEMBLY_ACC=CAM_ASM_001115 /LENGTH=210 /DNA_ID=CAMNT_0044011145 /DNA_START=102 /DNA_END=734 /DNA_ORIENTATION=-